MQYKKNCNEVYGRLTELYDRRGLDRIYAIMNLPNPELQTATQSLQDGVCPYPDSGSRIAFWDRILKSKTDVADDSLPMCYCSELDEGLVPGLLNAPDILFMMDAKRGWISSMSRPFINNLDDPLILDRTGLWAQRMLDQYKVFADGAYGKFGVAPLCVLNGLNFLVALRGATNAYMDIMDETGPLETVFEKSIETAKFIYDSYFAIVGLHKQGTIGLGWQWAPGKNIMDSIDAFHMTSEETFERWGKAWFEKLAACYDGSHVHIHANAYRMIPYVARLKGLVSINLGDDPYNPPAINRISEYDTQRGTVPLIVSVSHDEFIHRLEQRDLPGNTMYSVSGVHDVKEANEIMKFVKEYKIRI